MLRVTFTSGRGLANGDSSSWVTFVPGGDALARSLPWGLSARTELLVLLLLQLLLLQLLLGRENIERMASIAPAVLPAGDPSEKADMVDSYVFSGTGLH
jgi:hypothetical protein